MPFIPCLLMLLLMLPGCFGPKDEYDPELIRQGQEIFLDDRYTGDIKQVTCRYLLMELPGSIDLSKQDFYQENAINAVTKGDHIYIKSGLSDKSLQYWSANSLMLFGGELDKWPAIRDKLKGLGGIVIHDIQLYYQSSLENADIPLNFQESEKSIFVRGGESPRGFTLARGDYIFQLTCMPWDRVPPIDTTHVEILPKHISAEPTGEIIKTETGFYREYPKTFFDQLRMSLALQNGNFIGIILDQDQKNTVGHKFLESHSNLGHRQKILILSPHSEVLKPSDVRRSRR
ncbi:MAG: hypothetical protein JEZ07_13215 [Phycisphaerae bacterium]|nr:hypothetical protein [Phycisphaerae bacterium]